MEFGSILHILRSEDRYIIDIEQNTFINILDGTFFAARRDPFHPQEGEKIFLAVGVSGRGHGNESAALQPHYEPLKRKEALIIPEVGKLLAGRLYFYRKEHTAQVDAADDLVSECLLKIFIGGQR